MVYAESGTLITDRREVAESTTWDTQTEWEANQAADLVTLDSGTVTIQDIPARGIIGHWPGDEGSGQTLEDNEGSSDFTLEGPTWASESSFEGGTGLSFDRSQNDIATGILTQPPEFTWVVRVAANNLGSDSPVFRFVISHDNAPYLAYSVADGEWVANTVDDFSPEGTVRVADTQSNVESENRILVFRYDGTTIELDVYDGNQSLVGSSSANNSLNYQSETTYLGGREDGTRDWNGLMDPNLYQADRRISDTEVTNLLGEF